MAFINHTAAKVRCKIMAFVTLGLFSFGCQATSPSHHSFVPHSLKNKTIVLQVEHSVDSLYPSKGVVLQQYSDSRNMTYAGVGDTLHSEGSARYQYRRRGKSIASEKLTDDLTGEVVNTTFYFESISNGSFTRKDHDGDLIISGRFSLETTFDESFAPDSYSGTTVVFSILHSASENIPDGGYPGQGTVVLQSYTAENTYDAVGFGPGTVAHHGVYQYEKISKNVVVEQTEQTIPSLGFTANYTMVYVYQTPYSGIWYQNFADGLIIFSGRFTTFTSSN
ncbi:hypothetical protein [Paraglaciecola sp.]|uniref:hypothetical protein n=1 Tax=Paraglaciecola sp. TaxID=1920173 RepID=UPI003EFAE731